MLHAVIGFLKENIVCDIFLVLGLVTIFITYVAAPAASKKSGHHVSGIPAVGGLLIALGFLTSPVKWLALLGLLEPGVLYFIFRCIPDIIKAERDTKNAVPPAELEGGQVLEYSTYKNRYDEIRTPNGPYEGSYIVHPIVRYIITKKDGSYRLLEQEMNQRIARVTEHPSLEACRAAASRKAKWKTL